MRKWRFADKQVVISRAGKMGQSQPDRITSRRSASSIEEMSLQQSFFGLPRTRWKRMPSPSTVMLHTTNRNQSTPVERYVIAPPINPASVPTKAPMDSPTRMLGTKTTTEAPSRPHGRPTTTSSQSRNIIRGFNFILSAPTPA